MSIKSVIGQIERYTVANSPTILTVVGVVGTVTTAYFTGRASFKAAEKIYAAASSGYYVEPMSKKEKFDVIWKLYIPSVVSGAGTVTCIIAANRIGTKRAAALAAAVSLSERAFTEYREKIASTLGEDEEKAIRQEIMKDKVHNTSPTQVIASSGDDVLCHDAFSGRYFRSNMNKLRQAENEINYQIIHSGAATVSDFYTLVGLQHTSVSDELGWNQDKRLELLYASVMFEDREPCISYDFASTPIPNPWFMA